MNKEQSCLSSTYIPAPVSSRQGFVAVTLENATICSIAFRSPPITGCNVFTKHRALPTDLHNHNTDNEYITLYAEIFKRHLHRVIEGSVNKRVQAEALPNVAWSYIRQTS